MIRPQDDLQIIVSNIFTSTVLFSCYLLLLYTLKLVY